MSTNLQTQLQYGNFDKSFVLFDIMFILLTVCVEILALFISSLSVISEVFRSKRGTNTTTYLPCPTYTPGYPLSSYIKRILVKILKTIKILYLEIMPWCC